ncbi:hypothetical protein [Rhodococcus sp. BH5]|uniref:hypothetical protein n=1 Tax=Rhodococcus sp. BH5 TaxID=2871702 RepID=UPI0022CD88B9|nr:hypothetical protein [Rhodococcus sp. BH5]MCZ9634944.1 hypothetical protein [Rhodococcus sp. BH5]
MSCGHGGVFGCGQGGSEGAVDPGIDDLVVQLPVPCGGGVGVEAIAGGVLEVGEVVDLVCETVVCSAAVAVGGVGALPECGGDVGDVVTAAVEVDVGGEIGPGRGVCG